LWPIAAGAAPGREDRPTALRIRIAYRAADGCPDETAFIEALTAQAHPFERAPRSAARVRSLDAQITSSEGGHTGLLRVREADGATSERDVHGATCEEVFSALALVTALAIDTGPRPPNPPPPDETPEPPPSEKPHWAWATTVHGGAFFAMAPSATWGVTPSLEVAPPIQGSPLRARLGLTIAGSPRADTISGSAEFLWFAARLGFSLFSLARGPVALRPTATFGAGAIIGRGFAIALPKEQVKPWLDVTFGARAELMILPSVGVELEGGGLVPFMRDIWVFNTPPVIVHTTPVLGAYVTGGVRVVLGR
jgi:hypothetical protein